MIFFFLLANLSWSFDLSYSIIPKNEIHSGGPSKDGIPAIDRPKFATEDKGLKESDWVVGVAHNKIAKAYPLKILVWHENVNDVIGGKYIAVTYCPLCHSVFVFNRQIGGEILNFGISGLLYNSNVLLYNRKTNNLPESLWSQAAMKAVTGKAAKKKLKFKLISSVMTTWKDWKNRYPETLILSRKTGFERNYNKIPYGEYFKTEKLYFPVKGMKKSSYKRKTPVVIVAVNGLKMAFVVQDVAKLVDKNKQFIFNLGGHRLTFEYLKEANSLYVKADVPIGTAYLYWFSYQSLMPEVPLFKRGVSPSSQ